jgi:hypothetical protein
MNRRYVIVNYTKKQKKEVQKILHTKHYSFNEPFNGCTTGLYITEKRDYHEIVRLVDINYELMICPLTKVHVLYLNPKEKDE